MLDQRNWPQARASTGQKRSPAVVFQKCRVDRQIAAMHLLVDHYEIDSAIAPQVPPQLRTTSIGPQGGLRPHLGSATYQINQASIVIGWLACPQQAPVGKGNRKLHRTDVGSTKLATGQSQHRTEKTFSGRGISKCRVDRQIAAMHLLMDHYEIDSAIAVPRQLRATRIGPPGGLRPHLGSATYQINQASIVIGPFVLPLGLHAHICLRLALS